MKKRIVSIILSLIMIISAAPVMASAADASAASSAVSLVYEASDIAIKSAGKSASSAGFGSSFIEWFLSIFGYFKIKDEAKLNAAAGKNYMHEYTLKRDLTLRDTVKVTGILNLKGGKTIQCEKTCFEVGEKGSFSLKDVSVNSRTGEAIKNNGSCEIYSGTYTSSAENASVVCCGKNSVTTINGGTFNNPLATDLILEGSDAVVYYIGGQTNEAEIRPTCKLYMTGGYIGEIYNNGEFTDLGGSHNKIVVPESYKINSAADFARAAKKGGEWIVESDFTVDSTINIECESLKISGGGHTVTMKNGSVILNVNKNNELTLNSLNLKNSGGGCVATDACSTLVIENCRFESSGDTVVNCGYTQLSYSTELKTTGKNTFALKNMKADDNSPGTVKLYTCNVGSIENNSMLYLTQSGTVAGSIINNSTVNMENGSITTAENRKGAVWNMSGGCMKTFNDFGKFEKTGGTVDTLKGNYLIYPTKAMKITQTYNDGFSHEPHAVSGDGRVDFPIDEACEDTGRSYFYCPCDEMKIVRIYGVGTDGTNTIWLQSTSEVLLADGTSDYVTIMVIHPNDDTLKNLYIGQKFTRKTAMFLEGDDGNATGYHFHISVGKGITDNIYYGWWENANEKWVLKTSHGACKPEDMFYVDTSFTTVINNAKLNFKNLPR